MSDADRLTSLPPSFSLHRPFEDLLRHHQQQTAVADLSSRSQPMPNLAATLASAGYHHLLQQRPDASYQHRAFVSGLLPPHITYQQQLTDMMYSRQQDEHQRWLTALPNEHREPEGSRCGSRFAGTLGSRSTMERTGRDMEAEGRSRSPDSPSAAISDVTGSGLSQLQKVAASRDDSFSNSSDGDAVDDDDIEFNLEHRSADKCELSNDFFHMKLYSPETGCVI